MPTTVLRAPPDFQTLRRLCNMYILNLIANRVTQHDNIVIGLLTYMDSFTCMYTIILRSKFRIEFDLQVYSDKQLFYYMYDV